MTKKLNFILLKGSILFIFAIAGILLISCTKSKYASLVKSEMGKGVVYDSLIFGMKFGETKQDFFDQCWKLNNKGIIMQGPQNNFVKYDLVPKEKDSTINSITMLFYGVFNKEKIMTGMDMKFYYIAWSLWNKSLHSVKLVPVVRDSLKSWFPGNDFITVPSKKPKGDIYVKVDGNRRIVIKPLENTKEVHVRIDDLRYKFDNIN